MLYIRYWDVNSWARANHESHEHWTPMNSNDFTVNKIRMVIYSIVKFKYLLPCILWWHVLDFSNNGQRFWAVGCHRKTRVILWYSLQENRLLNNHNEELPNTWKIGTKHPNNEKKYWVYVKPTMYYWSSFQWQSSGKT